MRPPSCARLTRCHRHGRDMCFISSKHAMSHGALNGRVKEMGVCRGTTSERINEGARQVDMNDPLSSRWGRRTGSGASQPPYSCVTRVRDCVSLASGSHKRSPLPTPVRHHVPFLFIPKRPHHSFSGLQGSVAASLAALGRWRRDSDAAPWVWPRAPHLAEGEDPVARFDEIIMHGVAAGGTDILVDAVLRYYL